ncbi:MAG: rod shape-determining protein, partial [Chloroflexi bacterium]
MSLLSRKIGIDLGSSTVRIYVKGEGIVVNEPSGVATLPRL